jgi:prolipoprotein diacylglyceryl transferase
MLFNHIVWDASPVIFDFGGWALRWYGVFFALTFMLGHFIMLKIFQIEGKTSKELDKLALGMIASIVVGARLGHCLFYDPEYYFYENPGALLRIWEGGLASHGATIGIIAYLAYYVGSTPGMRFLWLADRFVIVVALGAFFVRMGNLMNSEICGVPSGLPWAFEYVNARGSDCSGGPRHPTQLYEGLSYLVLFAFLMYAYFKTNLKNIEGRMAGMCVTLLFTARFLIEFFKENQENYTLGLPLNTGQLLSIPVIAFGLWMWARSIRKPG